MRNLAPHIFRQRLLIEGFYTVAMTREALAEYLLGLAAHLGLKAYGEPAIYTPAGLGKAENQGFDAFLPLVDSGISAYVWSSARFFSIVLYTCKGFDEAAAVRYTREFFRASGAVESFGF
jgi:S-adenosylmethionine decarboxylase